MFLQSICYANTADASLSDDALASIFSRLPHTADAVRCAATCSRWARVVAARAADLSRSLPPLGRFVPELAVGVFHQEKDGPTARTRKRKRTASGAQPCFVALPAAGRRRPCIGSPFDGAGPRDDVTVLDFDHSRPVASRNGRLVLELRRDSRADDLVFCVLNPITGGDDAVVLPPLAGEDRPTDYGCAMLTSDDFHFHPRRGSTKFFFRLLLVYNLPRRTSTVFRCYSSDTGQWGEEVTSPVKVSSRELHHIGPSVVRRGVAFWPLDHGALGVRLAADDGLDRAADAHLLPYDVPDRWPEQRLLGVSPDDGRLFFMHFSVRAVLNILTAKISYFDIPGDDIQAGRKESSSLEQAVMMHQMEMTWRDVTGLKLRWVGEKSGVVLFTMQGRSSSSSRHDGAFALSLRDGTVEKVVPGVGNSWRNVDGLEMDSATYLASLAHGFEN